MKEVINVNDQVQAEIKREKYLQKKMREIVIV